MECPILSININLNLKHCIHTHNNKNNIGMYTNNGIHVMITAISYNL